MKTLARIVPGIFFALAIQHCVAGGGIAALTIQEYRDHLEQYSLRAGSLQDHPEQAPQFVTEIPDQLFVNTGTQNVIVNFRDFKNDLAGFSSADAAQRASRLERLRSYLSELQSAANAAAIDLKPDRRKLDEILSRREFRKVRGPNAADTFLAKIYRRLLRWLFQGVGRGVTSNVMHGIVYTLVGVAVLVMLLWTIRNLRRKEEVLPREIMPFAPSARNWRSWLAEARQSAEAQDWRNAIHLAYWAGISSLEAGGAWKPNRARTPREYLRLLGTRSPNHRPLTALTRKFEIVWYGKRDAGEADFQETLAQLEQLGCR
jgi:hypothetical protein